MTSARILTLLLVASAAPGCGKSGPPLPPLVRLPAAPADLTAARRGDSVDLRLVVPSANIDGSRPANLQRVDVYAYTGPANLTDDEVARLGTVVGSVSVKAPRDPDATVDPDEPLSDVAPPEGPGLEQGAAASLAEALTAAALTPIERPSERSTSKTNAPALPLTGPPSDPLTRFYTGVGITTRGRRGAFSRRAGVPLVPPPPPVPAPSIAYDESGVVVTWTPASGAAPPAASGSATEVLPSQPIGVQMPSIGYNVYELEPGAAESKTEPSGARLTTTPIDTPRFEDARLEWGVERCYVVRVVRTVNAVAAESGASPSACQKLVDTFPPKPPGGLQHIPSAGAVNLTWDQNGEKDLAGYLVLRGTEMAGPLAPLTPSPIPNSSYTDQVPSGVRFIYAIQAVDRAGNVSGESIRIEETAR